MRKLMKLFLSTMLALGLFFLSAAPANASVNYSVTTKTREATSISRTVRVGTSFTLYLTGVKSSGKLRVSKKGIVSTKKLKKNRWRIRAKKAGTVKITITAGGRRYYCKLKVKK